MVSSRRPRPRLVEVSALELELARRYRRDERIRVDLAVRMRESDAHLDPAVLERKDVPDLVARSELAVAVGPHFEEELQVREGQRAEARLRILRVDDHLAGAASRPGLDDLRRGVARERQSESERGSRTPPRPSGPAGTSVGCAGSCVGASGLYSGGRKERAVLPVGGVGDPFAAQGVPPQMRVRTRAGPSRGSEPRCLPEWDARP